MTTTTSIDFQTRLLHEVKKRIGPSESIGLVLSDVLSLSTDAAYRRLRKETNLTIDEVGKLCLHFHISFDELLAVENHRLTFDYLDFKLQDYSIEKYLSGILNGLKHLKSLNGTKIYMVVNNVHFFQALNFPEIIYFRLFFWAKSHLVLPGFEKIQFNIQSFGKDAYSLGRQILQFYNQFETFEVIDRELMRGYVRQIQYAYESGWFKDPNQVIILIEKVEAWIEHYAEQADAGKKFMVGTSPPADGSALNLFLNDAINTDFTVYYEGINRRGVYLTHNIMNYLHTTNERYVEDTKMVLDKQIANANLISKVNQKDRNQFFHELKSQISKTRLAIAKNLEEK